VKLARISLSLLLAALGVLAASVSPAPAHGGGYQNPTWWQKGQDVMSAGQPCGAASGNFSEPPNIDASNLGGPQSETSIAIDPSNPSQIVGGANDIFCLPMRGFFSTQGGKSGSWHAVNLPLPAPLSANGELFGSDPGVAWDTLGNVYYSYIVVFFNRFFDSITGTEMAVARSSDGGKTWTPTYFNRNVGTGKFNDKPMITVDTNPSSPHFNTVYVAWDNASFNQGKSSNNDVILVSSSTDHGVTFSAPVQASSSQSGQAAVIGADPFVAADGILFVAWTDASSPAIRVSSSTDGGATFGSPVEIAPTRAVFQTLPPAQALRGALIYPACGAGLTATGNNILYCSWTDVNAAGFTRLFESQSNDGVAWTSPRQIDDGAGNDQFNQWLAVDPTTQNVVLSWNDSRSDATRVSTDIFFAESTDRGASFSANARVTTASTNETVTGADLGNQYGDYEGIAAFNGIARPIWTDRRASIAAVTGLDEETFTETIKE
jgi:hypothetical protein